MMQSSTTVWVSGVVLLSLPKDESKSCLVVLKADGAVLLLDAVTSKPHDTVHDCPAVCIAASSHGPFAWVGCEKKQGVWRFMLAPGDAMKLVREQIFAVDAEAITSLTESRTFGVAYDSSGGIHVWPLGLLEGTARRILLPMLTKTVALSPVYCTTAFEDVLWLGTETGTVALYSLSLEGGSSSQAEAVFPVAHATNHGAAVTAIQAMLQHEIVLSGSESGEMIVWDGVKHEMLLRLAEHRGPVTAITYVPWLSEVWSASADGAVLVWTCGDPEAAFMLKEERPVGSGDYVSSWCVVPHVKSVFGGGSGSELTCWGEQNTTSPLPASADGSGSPSPSPDDIMPRPTSPVPVPLSAALPVSGEGDVPAPSLLSTRVPPPLSRTIGTSPPPQPVAAEVANLAALQEIEALRSKQVEQVEKLVGELATQRANTSAITAERDALRQTIAERETSIQELEAEVKAARQSREALGNLVVALTEQKRELQDKIDDEISLHRLTRTDLTKAAAEARALRLFSDDVLVPAVDSYFAQQLEKVQLERVSAVEAAAAAPRCNEESSVESMLEALMREVRDLKAVERQVAAPSLLPPRVATASAETQTDATEDVQQFVDFLERMKKELVLHDQRSSPLGERQSASGARSYAGSPEGRLRHSSKSLVVANNADDSGSVENVTIPSWLLSSLQSQLQLVETLLRQHREAIDRSSPQHAPATSTSILTSSYLTIRKELGPDVASRIFFDALQGDYDEIEATEMLVRALCRRCVPSIFLSTTGSSSPLLVEATEATAPSTLNTTPVGGAIRGMAGVKTSTSGQAASHIRDEVPLLHASLAASSQRRSTIMAPASSPPRSLVHHNPQQSITPTSHSTSSGSGMWRKLERSNLI